MKGEKKDLTFGRFVVSVVPIVIALAFAVLVASAPEIIAKKISGPTPTPTLCPETIEANIPEDIQRQGINFFGYRGTLTKINVVETAIGDLIWPQQFLLRDKNGWRLATENDIGTEGVLLNLFLDIEWPEDIPIGTEVEVVDAASTTILWPRSWDGFAILRTSDGREFHYRYDIWSQDGGECEECWDRSPLGRSDMGRRGVVFYYYDDSPTQSWSWPRVYFGGTLPIELEALQREKE